MTQIKSKERGLRGMNKGYITFCNIRVNLC